jgi:hypothetical protein
MPEIKYKDEIDAFLKDNFRDKWMDDEDWEEFQEEMKY